MKIPGRWIQFFALTALVAWLPAAESRFPLPAPVVRLVSEPEAFSRFITPVRTALPQAGLDQRLRLGMEAHLALNDRDASAALAAAAALRALEKDPAAKALAGLVTEAQVASWQPGTEFSHELRTRLAGLPRTPEITARLKGLREKIAATTPEALLAEAEAMGRRLDGTGECDWRGADEIIRLHHRRANVLPLRQDMLAALDDAMARPVR